jgi:hypothetical protein
VPEVADVLAAEWLFLLFLYRHRIFLRVCPDGLQGFAETRMSGMI